MALHFFELCRRQLSRFVQDVFGNGKLAHVMKQRGCFDSPQLLLVRDA